MNAYLSICDEVWIIVASYMDSIVYLLRWKIALSKKSTQFSFERKLFWLTLIEQFFNSQALDINSCLTKIRLSNISDSADTVCLLKELFSKKKCSRSGCLRYYREYTNNNGVCSYHPGKKNSSGYLTCCREKSFQTPGCKRGYHDGLFYNMVYCQRLPDTNSIDKSFVSSDIVLGTKSTSSPKLLPIIPSAGTKIATIENSKSTLSTSSGKTEENIKQLLKFPAIKS